MEGSQNGNFFQTGLSLRWYMLFLIIFLSILLHYVSEPCFHSKLIKGTYT